MKKTLRYILAAAVVCIGEHAAAQDLNSAYFMDGYAYGHELNPAKDYDRDSYFSVPLLPGNMNIYTAGSVGLRDFLKPLPGGQLATIFHPDFSYNTAMSGLKTNNRMVQGLRYDIVSFGFHAFKGYNTFTLGLRENVGFAAPKSLFSMLKRLENKDYDVSGFGVRTNAYVEAAFGHSHDVTEAVRVGGKVKLLFGGAYADMKFKKLNLDLTDENEWIVKADATAEVGVQGFTWGAPKLEEYSDAYKQNYEAQHPGQTAPETYEQIDFDNIDVNNPGYSGSMGTAFDLGAEWDLGKQGWVDGLKVSAALLDLGFIKWKNVSVAKNNGEPFVFDGFNNIKVEDSEGTYFEDQTDDVADRLGDLYNLHDEGKRDRTRMLGATLNVGVDYVLPYWNKIDFGLLSTTHIEGKYTWNEERLSANLHPCKWFEMGVSGGYGTFGASFGAILNVHPRGFNFFVGFDRLMTKVSKQMIPLNSNSNIAMGFNFPLGKSKAERFAK